ncbi:MAG: OmpA family protein, partial [Saprospiraceae bacterium]|nr:OmpA family protein [Saprospiraceae bacterium]MCB0681869.1 OmpA family protein [Saprospiraceae bacterium]
GIIDRDDQCPTLAGTAAANGCPDADNDGIPDNLDRCPDVAGPDSAGGCPDDDGDGIDNATDRCPNTAGPATSDGCPEISGADKEKLELAKQAVEFETSNAVLLPESYAVLDDIADILRRYADFKLRIGGHTDSVGSSRTNLELSEQRAKACYDYLVSKGIDPARMSYIGYGETKPIANNKYKEGRAQNRR